MSAFVGKTPLFRLNKLEIPNQNAIFTKLEFKNIGGSVKDRFIFYTLAKLKRQKKLSRSSILVEASAGNTGISIASAAIEFSCKAMLFVPEKFAKEKQMMMRILGAKLVLTPSDEGMQGAMKRALEFAKSEKNAIYLNQFQNKDNVKAHFTHTGAEIYKELKGEIDFFVCGAGSGGTFSGIASFLKSKDKRIKCILCDPKGSIIGGGKAGEAHIEGIGNHFVPEIMDTSLIDGVIKMNDEEAYEGVRLLARTEGILAGISSGAHLMAALKLAQKVKNKHIVTIFADSLERYLSRENLIAKL